MELMESNELLKIGTVAAMFGVNRSTVWRWQQDGLLTYIRLGKSVRYRRSDIEAFIAAGERKAKAQPAQK